MNHRPVPGDPGAAHVQAMFDANDDEWLMTAWGDFMTFAAETMTNDGGNFQKVVAIVLPVRKNHGTKTEVLRLMVSPAMAVALVDDMTNALRYL